MKPHVEGVIPNFTVTRSSSQTVQSETSLSDRVAVPAEAYQLQCQEKTEALMHS